MKEEAWIIDREVGEALDYQAATQALLEAVLVAKATEERGRRLRRQRRRRRRGRRRLHSGGQSEEESGAGKEDGKGRQVRARAGTQVLQGLRQQRPLRAARAAARPLQASTAAAARPLRARAGAQRVQVVLPDSFELVVWLGVSTR